MQWKSVCIYTEKLEACCYLSRFVDIQSPENREEPNSRDPYQPQGTNKRPNSSSELLTIGPIGTGPREV